MSLPAVDGVGRNSYELPTGSSVRIGPGTRKGVSYYIYLANARQQGWPYPVLAKGLRSKWAVMKWTNLHFIEPLACWQAHHDHPTVGPSNVMFQVRILIEARLPKGGE